MEMYKILLVDDEPDIIEILQFVLKEPVLLNPCIRLANETMTSLVRSRTPSNMLEMI